MGKTKDFHSVQLPQYAMTKEQKNHVIEKI